ncbi:MAG TPA: AAA family ATPase [Pyrinomonadaceae bacterium]|jgi:LuxR family maltose regulon positive regulatory protein
MVQVIPEKIAPPREAPRVSRERLLSTLAESLEGCNSTVVAARAGAGKTMLAADFARRTRRRVAWYKLDAPDAELPVFLRHLCASVAAARPGFGVQILERLGGAAGADDVPLAVEYVVHELSQSAEPLLVVLDDLHLVYDAEWLAPFFRRLLPLLPPEVHVMLLGRSVPPAPLWRMRSKQTLCVVDEAALAFTQEEARRLYASYGLPCSCADAALRETRGRAAQLDARARREGAGQEAGRAPASSTTTTTTTMPITTAAAARGARQTGRLSLRLIKSPRKSAGAA